jgi:hypothetical protein
MRRRGGGSHPFLTHSTEKVQEREKCECAREMEGKEKKEKRKKRGLFPSSPDLRERFRGERESWS